MEIFIFIKTSFYMKIRITERDIRKAIIKCVNEARSNGEAEVVNGPNIMAFMAWNWIQAMRDRMGGGKGVSEYKGKMYTVDDWYSTMYSKLRPYMTAIIRGFIGDEIKDLSFNRHEREILKNNEQDNPRFQQLANRPNKFIQPSDETVDDIYSGFFVDVDNKKSLYNKSSYICTMAYNMRSSANLVLATLRYYVYDYIRKSNGDLISMSIGTGPRAKQYNFNEELGIRNLLDDEDIAEEVVFSYSPDEARMKLKRYFQILLHTLETVQNLPKPETEEEEEEQNRKFGWQKELYKFNNGIQPGGQYRGKRYQDKERNNPGLINTVRYIVEHFDEAFPQDTVKELMNAKGMIMKQRVWSVKMRIAQILADAYNKAVNSKDTKNYILRAFGTGKEKHKYNTTNANTVYHRINPLWANVGPNKFGKNIQGEYADKFDESIDRAVRNAIYEIKKKKEALGSLYRN